MNFISALPRSDEYLPSSTRKEKGTDALRTSAGISKMNLDEKTSELREIKYLREEKFTRVLAEKISE